jgi:hypothetical protein
MSAGAARLRSADTLDLPREFVLEIPSLTRLLMPVWHGTEASTAVSGSSGRGT